MWRRQRGAVRMVTEKSLEPGRGRAVSEQPCPTTLGGAPAADPLQVQRRRHVSGNHKSQDPQ